MAQLARLTLGICLGLLLLMTGVARAEESDPGFDHFATGFELRGAHRDLQCDSCHKRGVFAGTPRECELCHVPSGPLDTSFKPQDHIPSTNACGSCHDNFNWQEIVRVDHSQVPQTCLLCHDGNTAAGKPPTHIISGQQCETCHSTMAWSPALFDHSNVTQPCSTCHNGLTATGKPAKHIATTSDCESCHSTSAWPPATFDHAGITGNCQSATTASPHRAKTPTTSPPASTA